MRLDLYLTQKQYFDSRNKAASAVKDGCFTVNGRLILKPSFEVSEDDTVVSVVNRTDYVARSAHKLLQAFRQFDLQWEGTVVADLGASTGGFCQVLLEKNVAKIYAVDIGTAQLHKKIKEDARVVNLEHTNARYLNSDSFGEAIDVVTADLSFISIKAVLPAIYQVLRDDGESVVLIKPQFEVGPKNLNKSGVVTDRKLHVQVLEDVASFAVSLGFSVCGISFSGLAGESGNREYLLYIKKNKLATFPISTACKEAVYSEESHG